MLLVIEKNLNPNPIIQEFLVSEQQISNEEMEDMKRVKSLEDSYLLIKLVTKTIKSKGGFVMLLGTLAANALGNSLTGKGKSKSTIQAGLNV